ncbi:unnamed protein product [Effrenium voratum]|nr:unnamed protein product [Effrenium voratum]CAJ1453035.1 unnamed protein product [Effrenium voratum]
MALGPTAPVLELHDGILALSFKSSRRPGRKGQEVPIDTSSYFLNGCDVRLLDPATATVLWALYGHTARITAFAECSDGRLASGGADGVLRIWEKRTWALEDGKEPPTLDLHGAADATGDVAAPPVLGTEAWAAEKPGVCSMARGSQLP